MKKLPWAKFTMPSMPKMIDRPSASITNTAPSATPENSCIAISSRSREARVMAGSCSWAPGQARWPSSSQVRSAASEPASASRMRNRSASPCISDFFFDSVMSTDWIAWWSQAR